MKRCWVGPGLLVLLLVLGLLAACFLGRFGENLSREAEQAAALTDTDRKQAQETLRQLRRSWEEKRFLLTLLYDHEPIREADTLFTLLESSGDGENFRENALRLAKLFQQIGQSQLPKWENIL